jgi:hypothetical protein
MKFQGFVCVLCTKSIRGKSCPVSYPTPERISVKFDTGIYTKRFANLISVPIVPIDP